MPKRKRKRPPAPGAPPTGSDLDFTTAGWNAENPAYVDAQKAGSGEGDDGELLGSRCDDEFDDIQPGNANNDGDGSNYAPAAASVPARSAFVPNSG